MRVSQCIVLCTDRGSGCRPRAGEREREREIAEVSVPRGGGRKSPRPAGKLVAVRAANEEFPFILGSGLLELVGPNSISLGPSCNAMTGRLGKFSCVQQSSAFEWIACLH